MYVIPYSKNGETTNLAYGSFAPLRVRTYAEILRALPDDLSNIPILKLPSNSWLSQKELRRRHIAEIFKTLNTMRETSANNNEGNETLAKLSLVSGSPSKPIINNINNNPNTFLADASTLLSEILGPVTDADRFFISNAMQHRKGTGLGRASLERYEQEVAVATDQNHWSVELMSVTTRDIIFKRNTRNAAKQISAQLPINSILRVCLMTPEECPFEGFSFFQIETFARVYHIMVREESHAQNWIQVIKLLLSNRITDVPSLRNHPVPDEPEKAYVVRLSGWNLTKSRVLNCRKIIFREEAIPKRLSELTVNQLIEHLLEKVNSKFFKSKLKFKLYHISFSYLL